MDYYQEITLLPDADISLGFIWQNVFQQVHLALVDNKIAGNQSAIAVSFPEYGKSGFPLGNKLRLFAKEQAGLEKLSIEQWLSRLEGYVHIKGIKSVPNDVTYVSFTRKQVKSPERIERDMQKKRSFGRLNLAGHYKSVLWNWKRLSLPRSVYYRLSIYIVNKPNNVRLIRAVDFRCLLR